MKSAKLATGGNCPLTRNPRLRHKADRMTAKIQPHFPPGLAQPALRALARAGYTHLAQLARVPEARLAGLHGMGPKALGLIRIALKTSRRR